MSVSGDSPKLEDDLKMDTMHNMDADAALKAERSDDVEVQKADGQTAESSKTPEEDHEPISYFSLYRYADKWDVLFIILGTTGALVNGAGLPVFAIFLGDIMNDIGYNQTNVEGGQSLTEIVNEKVPYFVYIGLICFVASYCQQFFWSLSAVRQTNRIRSIYLKSVLRQDIAYFDTEGTSGFLLQGLNEDCSAIQKGIGEKMAYFLFFMATCVSGIIIAFIRGWSMTLVILSLLPVLGLAGFLMTYMIGRMTTLLNRAFAKANSIAQQALGNVRTIYAFNGETRTTNAYDDSLTPATNVAVRQGFIGAATLGLTNCVAFCAYALAMWYGGTRIVAGEYTPGQVLNVLFAALIGGVALGQAAPNIQYFQSGKVSGRRVFGILARTPDIETDVGGIKLENTRGVLSSRMSRSRTRPGLTRLFSTTFR
jgi:ATP-binding cassette subfamily B (MDR/TAP) protein 1